MLLGREVVHGNVEPGAGLEDIAHQEADCRAQNGEDNKAEQRFHGHAAKLCNVGNAGRARHQCRENQRHDDHAHQVDEKLAEWLEPARIPAEIGRRDAGEDAKHHADAHLRRKTQTWFLAHNSPFVVIPPQWPENSFCG